MERRRKKLHSTGTSDQIVYISLLSWDSHPGPHKIHALQLHEFAQKLVVAQNHVHIYISSKENIERKLNGFISI